MSTSTENWNFDDNLQTLLPTVVLKRHYIEPSFREKIKFTFRRGKIPPERFINPGVGFYPRGLFLSSNQTDNTKFTWYTFLPIFLYQEFSDFSNVYYLILTMSQFINVLSVGYKISYIFPLACILAFRAVEELFQHFRIISRDKKLNEKLYRKM